MQNCRVGENEATSLLQFSDLPVRSFQLSIKLKPKMQQSINGDFATQAGSTDILETQLCREVASQV